MTRYMPYDLQHAMYPIVCVTCYGSCVSESHQSPQTPKVSVWLCNNRVWLFHEWIGTTASSWTLVWLLRVCSSVFQHRWHGTSTSCQIGSKHSPLPPFSLSNSSFHFCSSHRHRLIEYWPASVRFVDLSRYVLISSVFLHRWRGFCIICRFGFTD